MTSFHGAHRFYRAVLPGCLVLSSAAMTRAVRVLDGLAVVLAAATVLVIVTGGGAVGRVSLTRPEDFVVAVALIVGLRALLRPYRSPAVRPARAVVAGVLVYALAMGFIVVSRHVALRTHALDLGQPIQVLWNIAHGHGPVLTQVPMFVISDRMSRWGDHFEPILYVLAPLGWLWPGAVSLLLAQTVILAAGALAVFAYARERLDARLAAAFALLYLLNPTLHGINVRDMHPAAFAIPLVLAAALAFDRGRPVWCAVALALTLACREDAAVAVVGFGVWLALGRRRWLPGVAVVVIAVAVLFVDLQYVIPHYRGAPYHHLYRYESLGSSLSEILVTLGLRPWRWIPLVLEPAKIVYLLALLLPLGCLPLGAPRVFAAALPGLLLNLLSVDPKLYNYRAQYQAFVLPFLVLAAIEGFRRVRETRPEFRPVVLVGLAFVASAMLTAATVTDLGVRKWRLGPIQHAAYRLMARVPPEASISANERLVPHLSTRSDVWVFPRGVGASRYVLELGRYETDVPAARYEVLAKDGVWVLWRRRD